MPGYMNNFNTRQGGRRIKGEAPLLALLMAWKKSELKPALNDYIELAHLRPISDDNSKSSIFLNVSILINYCCDLR
ncbi:hypothetical protein KLMIMMO078B4_02150 [Klebsiella michiganensis]